MLDMLYTIQNGLFAPYSKGALFISSFLLARLKKIGSVDQDNKKKLVGKIKFSGVKDFQTQVMISSPSSSMLLATHLLSMCLCFYAHLCVCH
mgnify:CR=1 FL=1